LGAVQAVVAGAEAELLDAVAEEEEAVEGVVEVCGLRAWPLVSWYLALFL